MGEGPTPDTTGGPPTADVGRERVRRLAPFGIGAAVMLFVVLLWSTLVPSTRPVTQQNVNEAIASALASVTPPPAFSQLVYRAVQPSLVLVETTPVTKTGQLDDEEGGLGSGVVVTLDGDILTSLHVVE